MNRDPSQRRNNPRTRLKKRRFIFFLPLSPFSFLTSVEGCGGDVGPTLRQAGHVEGRRVVTYIAVEPRLAPARLIVACQAIRERVERLLLCKRENVPLLTWRIVKRGEVGGVRGPSVLLQCGATLAVVCSTGRIGRCSNLKACVRGN